MVGYLVSWLRRLQYERERYCKLASVSKNITYLKKELKIKKIVSVGKYWYCYVVGHML